jgi:hypothetical protein
MESISSFNKEVVLESAEELIGMLFVPLTDLLALPNLRKEILCSPALRSLQRKHFAGRLQASTNEGTG